MTRGRDVQSYSTRKAVLPRRRPCARPAAGASAASVATSFPRRSVRVLVVGVSVVVGARFVHERPWRGDRPGRQNNSWTRARAYRGRRRDGAGAGRARLYPGAWPEGKKQLGRRICFSLGGGRKNDDRRIPARLASGGRGRRRRGPKLRRRSRQAGRKARGAVCWCFPLSLSVRCMGPARSGDWPSLSPSPERRRK